MLAYAERAASFWQAAGGGARERALAMRLRGKGHEVAKNYPAAITDFRESLNILRSLSPKIGGVADGLNSVALALRASGQLKEAEAHYREALTIAEHLPYPEGVATYTGNLAELALDREQWSKAEVLAREALKLAEDVGRRELIAWDCRHLVKALAQQGRGAEGRCHADRAVAIYTELRSPELTEARAALDECLAADE